MIIHNLLYIVFVLLTIIICIIIYNKTNESFKNKKKTILIISRYNENLNWLKEAPFNKYPIIIYNKGPNNNFYKPPTLIKVKNIKNVGRCDHTYLYYIIENFNNLYDINIFLPGSCNMKDKNRVSKLLINKIENKNKAVFLSYKTTLNHLYDFKLDYWKASSSENNIINNEINLELSPVRPFGKWLELNLKNTNIKNVAYKGIFSISKEDILNNKIEHYINIIKYLNNSSNPEVGHYIERAWEAIFYNMKNTIIINI